MPVKSSAVSPLPLTDNFSVDVQIRISPSSHGYLADLCTDRTGWRRFPLRLQPQDVAELNNSLQEAVQQVANAFILDQGDPTVLLPLAQKGNYAFKKIFADSVPRSLIQQALKKGATIQFSSEDFFIPWELLYDGPLYGSIDALHFWGMRHIVSRVLIRDARPGDLETPLIQASSPHVGLIVCDELEQVMAKEVPALHELHRKNAIRLSSLRAMRIERRERELQEFSRFLNKKLQVVHFACHAHEGKHPSESYLLVSDSFPITMEDFTVYELSVKHKPFVILNACLTGTMSPLYTSNWAAVFWERGARGVLATEFQVPDWFAASFTGELYQRLLAGIPIGEALIRVRRSFWEKNKNPLGLAYALYSSPSIKLIGKE